MRRWLFCLLSTWAFAVTAKAHVLDQYLQVAQIAIESDGARIELRLVPGAQVANRIFALIDADGDGQISSVEEQAYARHVLADIALEADEQRASLTLTGVKFPTLSEMKEGNGAIRLKLAATLVWRTMGEHQLFFHNNHLPELGAYLANALVPENDSIAINRQERDALQHGLQIYFQVKARSTSARLRWLGPAMLIAALALPAWWMRSRLAQKASRIAMARSLMRSLMMLWLLVLSAAPAYAHPEPVTLVMLDVAPDKVTMTLHIPLAELELAFGNDVATNPEAMLSRRQTLFKDYLLNHIHPVTQSRPWSVAVLDLQIQKSDQTPKGMMEEAVVRLALTPPAGTGVRRFTLNYDVILHQVVTHKALVSIRNDWEGGQTSEQQVGVIQVNTGTGRIDPFEINLEMGSWWTGFAGMVSHGMQHIKEGTDHLLFLLALLLPATLLVNGRRWGGFGGSRYSLVRLLKIVTAFTLGHSLTLPAGALGWVQLPQQPVESLIAFSILVSAIHAMRPLFSGKEVYVAAGFGLVHGLAFAMVLSDLHLSAGPMALSILGFNLGIELMQLFVIAVTMPWLVLLSLTPLYPRVRVVCATLAALAALGWMASRLTGKTNFIEHAMQTATEFAPLGILLLALFALPAYFMHMSKQRKQSDSARKLPN